MRALSPNRAIILLAIALAALVSWQFREASRLRAEMDHEHGVVRAREEAGAAQRRRAAEAAKVEINRARSEVDALRQQVESQARVESEKEAAERFAPGRVMPESEWKNAGFATPKAALETVLWAGANGDVNALAGALFCINRRVQMGAQGLLDGLPAALREQINTPEQAVAFLTINDMPRGSAEVRKSKALDNWPAPTELIDVFLTGEDERRKDVQLVFTNQNGAWKLVVMEGVIAKYTNQLKEGVSASAALPRANP